MLTCAGLCGRVLTYAGVCERVRSRYMLPCAEVCRNVLTWSPHSNACWRVPTWPTHYRYLISLSLRSMSVNDERFS